VIPNHLPTLLSNQNCAIENAVFMLKSTEHEPQGATMTTGKRKYSPLFWLTIMFEFFERGSYYGMMSVLSVYFTDVLMFQKESVGIIKSTIQPL